jgi:hypothetical protein
MLKKISLFLLLTIIGRYTYAGASLTFPFAGSTVELLDSAAAAAANGASDPYSRALTPFDLQIRLGKLSGAREQDYLAKAAAEVRNWPLEEQEQLKAAFAGIEKFLSTNKIRLNLPATIQMIKTEGKEEFGAEGYTRENRISLNTGGQNISVHLVAHELFHVYSRHNEKKRDAIYGLFGFRKCNVITTAPAFNGRIVTNPDCPFIEHYITLDRSGKPTDMVLQLYSKKEYNERYTFEDYMNVALLAVDGDDTHKKPVMKEGSGEVFDIEQVPELFAKISTNTPYILHPEEISAEHFAMMIMGMNVQQPTYIEKLKAVLLQ